MAWTALTYALNSLLTSAKMTQNQDNFTALAQGLSGAPKILDAAIDATGITTRSKLPTAIAYEDEANTWSALQTFQVTPIYTATPFDLSDMLFISDDFMSNDLPAGELGWLLTVTGSGSATSFSAETSHPGAFRLLTGSTNNSRSGIHLGPAGIGQFKAAENFDLTWIIKPLNSDANTRLFFGLADAASTPPPSNGIYIEKAFSDTNWFAVCRSASTQTRTDLGTAASVAWFRLRIRRKDGSTISFSINGGTETDITTNIPTSDLIPYGVIVNSTTLDKEVAIDAFNLFIKGLSR